MNKFWEKRSSGNKKNHIGKPRIFDSPQQMEEECIEYFEYMEESRWKSLQYVKSGETAGTSFEVQQIRPFTILSLTLFLGVNKDYFSDFKDRLKGKDDDESLDFARVINWVEGIIDTQKFEGAVLGHFNATIISKDMGQVERIKNETTIKIGVDSESEIEYED